jgi:hypothetical protein
MKRRTEAEQLVTRVRWMQGRTWRYGHLAGQVDAPAVARVCASLADLSGRLARFEAVSDQELAEFKAHTAMVVETDGSVRVWDTPTGGARSLPLEALQHQTCGPRGGRRWEWIVARPAPVVTAVCAVRPAWNPPEGPAEMFDQAALFEVGS